MNRALEIAAQKIIQKLHDMEERPMDIPFLGVTVANALDTQDMLVIELEDSKDQKALDDWFVRVLMRSGYYDMDTATRLAARQG